MYMMGGMRVANEYIIAASNFFIKFLQYNCMYDVMVDMCEDLYRITISVVSS